MAAVTPKHLCDSYFNVKTADRNAEIHFIYMYKSATIKILHKKATYPFVMAANKIILGF